MSLLFQFKFVFFLWTLLPELYAGPGLQGKGSPIMEGKLVAASEPGRYLISSREGPVIEQGQSIEIFLAGSWISGTVAAEGGESELAGEEDDDLITEASEESFPASDPPAWTTGSHSTLRQQESTSAHPTFYFVADSDGSVCGLCTGMLVRVSS